MADDWRAASLDDVCTKITDGAHNSPKSVDFGGRPMASVKDMTPLGLNLDSARRISEMDYDLLVRQGCRPEPGDVLIAKDGNSALDTVCNVRSSIDAVLLSSVAILRPHPEILDSDYLKYYLSTPQTIDYLKTNFISGAAIPRVVLRDFKKAKISYPPLREQHKIADVLRTFDDKIELNRRMSETLEAMARALFKSWFVDFDPVRAKMEGRWKRGQSLPGLPAHLYDLFPGRLVGSELGEIPEGWEVKSLDGIARFLNGLALQKYPPRGGRSLPVIKIAQLRAGNTYGADQASADLEPKYIVHNGDILFSWSGSLECVLWAGGSGALNQHLFKVTSNDYPRWLCYLGVHTHLNEFRHVAAGKATTMGHIQRHHLADAKLAVPTRPLLDAIDKAIGPIVESLWKREVDSRTLATLRDTLLPKLIFGELRIASGARLLTKAS